MKRRNFLFAAALVAGSLVRGVRAVRAAVTDDPVQARAEAIARDLADQSIFQGFGVEILVTILQALLPALLKCLLPQPAPPTPEQIKAFAEKAWNERRQQYDARTVRRVKVQAKKRAKANDKLLSDDQAHAMAVEILDHARLGDDADLKTFSAAAWKSPVEAAKEE